MTDRPHRFTNWLPTIDRTSGSPYHVQVAQQTRAAIGDGTLPAAPSCCPSRSSPTSSALPAMPCAGLGDGWSGRGCCRAGTGRASSPAVRRSYRPLTQQDRAPTQLPLWCWPVVPTALARTGETRRVEGTTLVFGEPT